MSDLIQRIARIREAHMTPWGITIREDEMVREVNDLVRAHPGDIARLLHFDSAAGTLGTVRRSTILGIPLDDDVVELVELERQFLLD